MSDTEKIMAIKSWMGRNIKYDGENYYNNTIPYISYTAKGALLKGVCVCQGYAEAFHLFMKELKIKDKHVYGEGGDDGDWGDHAWNMVKLGKNWYHMGR